MSRSRKKVPGYTDRNPWAKRQANKRVRKTPGIPEGKAYKKFYCSYDICDWTYLLHSKAEIRRYLRATRQGPENTYRVYTK